jgi:hypothetical protein
MATVGGEFAIAYSFAGSSLKRSRAMPRLCANLGFLFAETPFPERFNAAAHAGFTEVEYESPYDYPAAELRARLKAAGYRGGARLAPAIRHLTNRPFLTN